MTLVDLRDEIREAAADTVGTDDDYLWSDDELTRYINRIYRKIASETLCIRDSTTPSVCLIDSSVVDYTTYTVGTMDYIWANDSDNWLYQKNVAPYLYDLHSAILRIDEVKWVNRPWKLRKVSAAKWQTNPWWEVVVGPPTEYATDLTTNKIALNFRSETDDTLRLQVRRLPLSNLVKDSDSPEFRTSYHDYFINGVLSLMYLKQDSQAFDQDKAARHAQMFLADLDEIKQQETGIEARLNPTNSLNAFR